MQSEKRRGLHAYLDPDAEMFEAVEAEPVAPAPAPVAPVVAPKPAPRAIDPRILEAIGPKPKDVTAADEAAAKTQAADDEFSAGMGSIGARLAHALNQARNKKAPDLSYWQKREAGAGAPLAAVEARKKAVQEWLAKKHGLVRQGEQDRLESEYKLGQIKNWEGDHERGRAQLEARKTETESKQAFDAEQARLDREARAKSEANARRAQREIERMRIEAEKAEREAKGKAAGAGAQLPAGEASQIGQLDAADKTLADLSTAWDSKASDWYSGLAAKSDRTDAGEFEKQSDAAAQTIGTILEGGKLTDADLAKYKALVPRASDSASMKAAKVEMLKTMIENTRSGKIKGLMRGGFDVSGFLSSIGANQGAAPQAPSTSPSGSALNSAFFK